MAEINLEQLNDENPWMTRRKFVELAAVVAGGLILSSCGHSHESRTLDSVPLDPITPETTEPQAPPINQGAQASAGATRMNNAYQEAPLPLIDRSKKFYYPGEFLARIATAGNEMVFTFDDGPDDIHCIAAANILRDRGYEGQAGYVQVSNNALMYPHVTRELYSRGFEIMNHTKTHAHYDGPTEASEIERAQEDFYGIIGEYPQYFRAAGGTRHSAIDAELKRLDMCYWWTDADEEDWVSPRKTPDYINGKLRDAIHPGYISLRHSGGTHDNTVNAMHAALDITEEAGLTCLNPRDALARRIDFDVTHRNEYQRGHAYELPSVSVNADGPIGYDLAADMAKYEQAIRSGVAPS